MKDADSQIIAELRAIKAAQGGGGGGGPSIPTAALDTDGTLAANSDEKVASQKAVKTYADSKRPYLVYTALLTQSGEPDEAPVATVLENTLGGTVVWTYEGQGTYNATLADAFPEDTWMPSVIILNGGAFLCSLTRVDASTIQMQSDLINSGGLGPTYTPTDGALLNTPIEIRVYP